MTTTKKTYPFTITCGDQKPRRAASLRGAKVAMGRMMNNVPKGTRGEIRNTGTLVLTAECYSLGWVTVDDSTPFEIKVPAWSAS